MRSKIVAAAALTAFALSAQETPLAQSAVRIHLPTDSPVALLGANLGESRALARGSATVLDLHMALSLRNTSSSRVRGVTLRVVAQEVTPGGKASVAVPSLNAGPGEVFPVRIDLQLMRPTPFSAGPLVEVDLDGVLFQDLSFYGPNRLDSRRSLTAWELEAQRDRQHFKQTLAAGGAQAVQREILDSLARQADRPRLDVRVARASAVGSAAVGAGRAVEFAFLRFPDSPIEPLEGTARIAMGEAQAPRVEVRNNSGAAVRYIEIGWIVEDAQGRQYMAASLPASGPSLRDTSLRLSQQGQPVNIRAMTGFVSQVEFANGKVWVPTRRDLDHALLRKVLPPSAEEQRLTGLYRKKGLAALVEELKRW